MKKGKPLYSIPHALWKPTALFPNATRHRPLVGVGQDKLASSSKIDIELGFYKTKPVYESVDTQAFISLAEAKNWKNTRKGNVIYYLSPSLIETVSEKVRE
jgi:hypothetical protein